MTEITDQFTSLSNWELAEASGLTASSNKVWGTSKTLPAALCKTAFEPGATGNFRVVGSIFYKPGGTAGKLAAIGVSTDTGPTETGGFWSIGIDATGRILLNNSSVLLTGMTEGTYLVTITGDAKGITFEVQKSDRSHWTLEYKTRAEVGTIKRVLIYNSDPRGTSGNGIAPLGAITSLATLATRTNIEGIGTSRAYLSSDSGGHAFRIEFPAGYETGKTPPAIIYYCHGAKSGSLEFEPIEGTCAAMFKKLLEAGYVIVSGENGGESTLGNELAIKCLKEQREYVHTNYPTAPVLLLSFSAGGLCLTNSLRKEDFPINGAVLISPFLNLGDFKLHKSEEPYAAFNKVTSEAYGLVTETTWANYTEKIETPELAPLIWGFAKYHGQPIGIMASPEDVTAPKAKNAQLLKEKLEGHEFVKEVLTTGTHDAEGQFPPAATLKLVEEVLAAGEAAATITKPGNQSTLVGAPVGLEVFGTNMVTVTAKELPAGLSLTKNSTSEWEIAGKPTTPKSVVTVTLEAKNGAGAGENTTFTWTIKFLPATITKPSNQSTVVGAPISTVKVEGTHMEALTSKELPAGLTLTKIGTNEWTITGTPTTIKGVTTVTLEAKNGEGVGENTTFTWTVTAEAAATIVKPENQISVVGTTYEISVIGTNMVTLTAKELPAGLSLVKISVSEWLVDGTPTTAKSVVTVTLEAKNGAGAGENTTFTWRVKLEPATVSTPANQVTVVGIPISTIKLTGTHIATMGSLNLPAGLKLNKVNETEWTITGTPTTPKSVVLVELQPENAEGNGEDEDFSWEVLAERGGTGLGLSLQDIRQRFPLHLLIGGEDYTFLLAENFTFSNVDPGGYEMASFSFGKDLPKVLRGMTVRLDSGTQVAWEGRVKEVQRSLGAKTLIQCEGNGAKLKDQELSMVFVDRDLTRWGSPATARVLELTEADYSLGSSAVGVSSEGTLPAFLQMITGSWVFPAKPTCEAWYDAGPENLIGSVYFSLASNVNGEDEFFERQVVLSSDSKFSKWELITAHPKESTLFPGASAWFRYAMLDFKYIPTPAGSNGFEYLSFWQNLAVYGRHGLTLRGSAPYGLYASDIVKWVVSKLEGIVAGVIPEASFYIVPHAVYYTPVEAQQMVADMAKLVGYHWGVWESLTYLTGSTEPRLDFRPYPGQGESTAWCWREECETLDIREDLSSQYNTAQVTYTETSGEEGAVEVTVDNPILDQAEIKHRTILLSLGTSTPAGAEEYGRLALKLLQEQARVVGSASIGEAIHRVGGGEIAPWMLKSGIDRLRIPDLPSFDVWGEYNELPITRVETSGGEDSIKTDIEFGQGKNLLEALTAELQQAAVLSGQGA